MKKVLAGLMGLLAAACAQDPYRLKIDNNLSESHGQSIYFRSNLRSTYAAQIRRVLSNKFGEIGLRTTAATEDADLIGIFDIETFYKQSNDYKHASYAVNQSEAPLFTTIDEGTALSYSGNADMTVNHDKTCFTLKIGRKETSIVKYASTFCADTIKDAEDMLPMILDIYGKYASYKYSDIGVQCLSNNSGQISCNPVRDRQQAFINSLWTEYDIPED